VVNASVRRSSTLHIDSNPLLDPDFGAKNSPPNPRRGPTFFVDAQDYLDAQVWMSDANVSRISPCLHGTSQLTTV